MPGRGQDAMFTVARAELMRRLAADGVSYLDEHERSDEVERIVRELGSRFPELNGRMSEHLISEGIHRPPAGDDATPDLSFRMDMPSA